MNYLFIILLIKQGALLYFEFCYDLFLLSEVQSYYYPHSHKMTQDSNYA